MEPGEGEASYELEVWQLDSSRVDSEREQFLAGVPDGVEQDLVVPDSVLVLVFESP